MLRDGGLGVKVRPRRQCYISLLVSVKVPVDDDLAEQLVSCFSTVDLVLGDDFARVSDTVNGKSVGADDAPVLLFGVEI